jgi:hypothetical protein
MTRLRSGTESFVTQFSASRFLNSDSPLFGKVAATRLCTYQQAMLDLSRIQITFLLEKLFHMLLLTKLELFDFAEESKIVFCWFSFSQI